MEIKILEKFSSSTIHDLKLFTGFTLIKKGDMIKGINGE